MEEEQEEDVVMEEHGDVLVLKRIGDGRGRKRGGVEGSAESRCRVTARTINLPDAGDVVLEDLGVNSVVHEYMTVERRK